MSLLSVLPVIFVLNSNETLLLLSAEKSATLPAACKADSDL